jgi:Baseplate J-like protein
LWDRTAANFSSNVLGGSPIIPESLEWYVVANDYAMAEEFYSIAASEWRERDPRYACCDNLVAMAALDGVFPKPALPAQGYVKVTGRSGATIPSPMEFIFGETKFKSVGQVPAVMPSQGFVIVQMRAIVPGSSASTSTDGLTEGSTGTLNTSAVNISKTVTRFGVSSCGGSDAETCEDFRTRYLNRKKYQPRANAAWLFDKIKEWPCVTRAVKREGACCSITGDCNCGCSDCVGKLEFYALFDGTFECGIAPDNVIVELDTWLFGTTPGLGEGQVEIGVCGKIYPVKAATINVEVFSDCRTPAQEREINAGIADIFAGALPSRVLRRRDIDLLLAQVIGLESDFGVGFTMADQTGTTGVVNSNGDAVMACDYMPCLGTITYGAVAEFRSC